MFRITRKQKIVQSSNVIELEDSCDFESPDAADLLRHRLLFAEHRLGGKWYTPGTVIFESPSFYRSVTVIVEKLSDA